MTLSQSSPDDLFPTRVLRHPGWLAVACLFAWPLLTAAQARFTPEPGRVVVPVSMHATATENSALREAERDWRGKPADMALAIRYARIAFQVGQNEGDLRWFGAAKAALLPWWEAPVLPAQGHFVRGLVRQGFHDFSGGLADINAAIALDPGVAAFWSWRFVLHLLVADMDAARLDCEALRQRLGEGEGQACAAVLLYRSGSAASGAALLEQVVKLPAFQDSGAQDWLRFHLGEAWRVAGQAGRAEAVWREYLARQPRAHAIRLTLAELLNEQLRFPEARRVAAVGNPSDALLVQSLLASRGLGDGEATRLEALVAQRMSSQTERGEALIERPRMIYLIRGGGDVRAGLALAAENWQTQKEPPDAVLLVEAALKVGQPRAAAAVLDWMARTGYTDPALAALVPSLKAALARS